MRTEPNQAAATKFSWGIQISLLNNRFIIWETARALLGGILVVILLLTGLALLEHRQPGNLAGAEGIWAQVKWPLLFLGFVFAATMAIIACYYGNRYGATYVLDARGIRFTTQPSQQRKNRLLNNLLIVLGLFSGRPMAAGIGGIANSRQTMTMRWTEVRKIIFYQRQGVIMLKGGFANRLLVFCPKGEAAEIHAKVSNYCDQCKN